MTNETKHTPEPWKFRTEPEEANARIYGKDRRDLVAVVWSGRAADEAVAEANARRIVACVNACAGYETSLLEDANATYGGLKVERERIRDHNENHKEQRDELAAALHNIGYRADIDVAGMVRIARAALAKVTK